LAAPPQSFPADVHRQVPRLASQIIRNQKNIMNENEENKGFKVLVNHEEQYSLWSDLTPIPKGWREVKSGTKQECLDYVNQVWTDMRPLSLRKKMEATAAK
jgi:MbtH protein